MARKHTPIRENAAHSQSEPWDVMWKCAVGGLTLTAWLPPIVACLFWGVGGGWWLLRVGD